MFLAWIRANKKYTQTKLLTYAEFPKYFAFKLEDREWHERKQGFSIGKLQYVPPSNSELYYLRILLTKVGGLEDFSDIITYLGTIHDKFRGTWYARGLLDDDNEFISAIKEVSFWGSGHELRFLFTIMLLSNTMSRPEFIWEQT